MRRLGILACSLALVCAPLQAAAGSDHVILLHGLARTNRSMNAMEESLRNAGYQVHNLGYPSRTAPVGELAEQVVGAAVAEARQNGAARIHFVTHSLGGILVRTYLARHRVAELGRVVMLGPPNRGSEVVNRLGAWRLFGAINGPAGRELGTAADSAPNALGPAEFSLGVIAGNRSINWINSLMIPGRDDGKVSVERTKVAGMTDHIVIPVTHPYLMKRPAVIRQVLHFLANGAFAHALESPAPTR
jgi:pimeloyl-ACP methyl ester carboxylesterase